MGETGASFNARRERMSQSFVMKRTITRNGNLGQYTPTLDSKYYTYLNLKCQQAE